MSGPWEVFRRAWEHGFNVGYLQGYIPFVFILNRYYYFSSNGIELEDVYRKLAGEGFFDWYLDRNALWKRTDRHYILNTLIPELVNLYGDYVMQIVQYEASLADISLAILTSSDLDDYERALIYRQRRDIEQRYNDMYEAGTLTIIEYSYDSVVNPEAHDPVADMLRGGDVLWKRGENKNE